jgi:uncharacterized protein
VAAISDLHAGGPNMTVAHIRLVIEGANELRPDLVVLLGDYFAAHRFVTEHVPRERWARELGRLAASLRVWAVLGNHDCSMMSARCEALSQRLAFPASKTRPFCQAG